MGSDLILLLYFWKTQKLSQLKCFLIGLDSTEGLTYSSLVDSWRESDFNILLNEIEPGITYSSNEKTTVTYNFHAFSQTSNCLQFCQTLEGVKRVRNWFYLTIYTPAMQVLTGDQLCNMLLSNMYYELKHENYKTSSWLWLIDIKVTPIEKIIIPLGALIFRCIYIFLDVLNEHSRFFHWWFQQKKITEVNSEWYWSQNYPS